MACTPHRQRRVRLAALTGLALLGCNRNVPPPELDDPLPGLTPEERARFDAGELVFERTFTPEQGLGPLFNAEGCATCHDDPIDGGNGDLREVHATGFGEEGACDGLEEFGGPVVQGRATPALTAALGITSEPVPAQATGTGTRTTPDVFGFGLLDAIPDATLLALADPDDRDGDGISGRVNHLAGGRIGRFGRKAASSSLADFNAGAFLQELGLTSPALPHETTVGGAPLPDGVDPLPEPEISAADAALADDYVRFLAPPAPGPQGLAERRGEQVFARIGCAACHVPSLRTGPHEVAALAHKLVHAYTDLLLHDMGPALADVCLGEATPSEFRTEPLMGLRHARTYLHDGRAHSVAEAIELHDGEAARARALFRSLSPPEREHLLAFLASL